MNSLESLYQLRTNFIIIGLTGRLGSGCTTTAELLNNSTFEQCNFPIPVFSTSPTNEERKYRITYNFLQNNWYQYTLIRASDVITAFLLRKELDEVCSFLNNNYPGNAEAIDKISKNMRSEFEELSPRVKEMFNNAENSVIDFKNLKKEVAAELFFKEKKIEQFSVRLKNELKRLKINSGHYPFQNFGDNLRKTGDPLNGDIFDPNNCYIIARVIHELVKIIRKTSGDIARVVIDSIRNSMEARYFKERYSAFYLFAVNTEEQFRQERLNNEFNLKELKALDQEYTKNLKTDERFYKQDIQTCIQVADIYLHNPDESDNEGDQRKTLKKDVLRYLSLILQPGIITPTPEERCMQIAYTAKYNSGCISRQVGAVVSDSSFSIKSIGWNNTAEGQTPCLLRSTTDLTANFDPEAYSQYEKNSEFKELINRTYTSEAVDSKNLKGRNISFCFKDGFNCLDSNKNQVHTRSLHAEENAMLQIAKYGGEGLKGGFLFTTASPCELCSKKAYQLGIHKIFFIDPYPGISDRQILKSGVPKHQPTTKLFVGAVGRAYHHLFEPFMPYKDELKTLINFDYEKSKIELIRGKEGDAKQKEIEKLVKIKDEIEAKINQLSK